jgi:lipopolysaccharide transport system permease protein
MLGQRADPLISMSQMSTEEPSIHVIEPSPGWRAVDFKELYRYRDLLRFLTWRSIKALYAQSAIGIGWAVIQPLFSMVVFTIVFGRFAKIDSNGVPYSLFSLTALVPWTYFSSALLDAGNSLVSQSHLLSKVYFPRLILPISGVMAKLVDFCVAMTMLVGLMAFYRIVPTWNCVFLPLLIAVMVASALGIGLWMTSLAIQFRDIRHALTFLVQLGMYSSPVIYSVGIVPEKLRYIYAINPMVGVIEGFRSSLLGTGPMPWDLIGIGIVSASFFLFTGIFYFRRQERIFSDVA